MKEKLCPCGMGKAYQECCEKYHLGAYPQNALQLMRSRYSAYALCQADYIIKTTHPANPHINKDLEEWKKEILQFCQKTEFQKLEILEFLDEEPFAYVTFVAHLKQGGRDATFAEKSRFEKINAQWFYLAGQITQGRKSIIIQ